VPRHHWILSVLLTTLLLWGCSGGGSPTKITPTSTEGLQAHTLNLSTGTSLIQSGKWRDVVFTVESDMKYINIEGWFHAAGGGQGDIEVFICEDYNFSDWQSGRKITPVFNTGRKTIGEINFSLPEKWIKYHLIFSNIFSDSVKTVQSQIDLKYYTESKASTDNTSSGQ
jgi:hypothetical protein